MRPEINATIGGVAFLAFFFPASIIFSIYSISQWCLNDSKSYKSQVKLETTNWRFCCLIANTSRASCKIIDCFSTDFQWSKEIRISHFEPSHKWDRTKCDISFPYNWYLMQSQFGQYDRLPDPEWNLLYRIVHVVHPGLIVHISHNFLHCRDIACNLRWGIIPGVTCILIVPVIRVDITGFLSHYKLKKNIQEQIWMKIHPVHGCNILICKTPNLDHSWTTCKVWCQSTEKSYRNFWTNKQNSNNSMIILRFYLASAKRASLLKAPIILVIAMSFSSQTQKLEENKQTRGAHRK